MFKGAHISSIHKSVNRENWFSFSSYLCINKRLKLFIYFFFPTYMYLYTINQFFAIILYIHYIYLRRIIDVFIDANAGTVSEKRNVNYMDR